MYVGKHNDYYWLEGYGDTIPELLQSYPEIILGRRLLLQSHDKDVLSPPERISRADWLHRDHLALSPPLHTLTKIPQDMQHYSGGWFIFTSPDIADRFATLPEARISPPHTSLRDPQHLLDEPTPGDRPFDAQQRITLFRQRQQRFWVEIERFSPESHLHEGRPFVFVTRDRTLHDTVAAWIQSCDTADTVTATRLLDARELVPNRHILNVAIGPRHDVAVLSSEQPLYGYERRETSRGTDYLARPVPGPHRYQIHHQTESGIGVINLPETSNLFYLMQPLSNQQWLAVSFWADESLGGNAHIYGTDGRLISSFDIGQGIHQIHTSADGHTWVGYNDEGVYKYGSFGQSGAVCFDQTGKPILKYLDIARQHDLPVIDDCEAISVASDASTWLYYFRAYALVHLSNHRFDRIWRNFPVIGSRGFAIAGDQGLFAGSSRYPDKVFQVALDTLTVKKLQPIDQAGNRIAFSKAVGRGSQLYLFRDHEVFAVQWPSPGLRGTKTEM